jgi:predicted aspartyl protease
MVREGLPNRRAIGAGLLGALATAGCASDPNRGPVLVNVTVPPPPPTPDEAHLDTGLDPSLRMTAPVRINGKGPFTFVVDSGANRSVVALELAQELGLPSAGMANVHGVAGVEPAETVHVDLLEVDAVTSRDLRAPALSRARLGADGLIGVDVLKNRRVLMNFLRGELSISAQAGSSEPGAFDMKRSGTGLSSGLGKPIIVPAHYRFGQLIIVGADVARRRVTAFVDTGSQSTVGNNALRRAVLASGAAPKAVRAVVPVLSATGQTAQAELGVLPLLRIGGLSITGLMTAFADLHVFKLWDLEDRPSLLLGMDVLRQFNAIELNYARRHIAFYLRNGSG